MQLEAVGGFVDRLVRAAEAQEIGGDHPVSRRHEDRDHAAVEIAPGRLAVQAEPGPAVARADIHIVQPQAIRPPMVGGCMGPARQVLEAVVRCAQGIGQWCILRA